MGGAESAADTGPCPLSVCLDEDATSVAGESADGYGLRVGVDISGLRRIVGAAVLDAGGINLTRGGGEGLVVSDAKARKRLEFSSAILTPQIL